MKLVLLLLAFVAVAVAESDPLSLPTGLGRKLRSDYVCNPRTGTDWFGGDLHKEPYKGLGSASACCNKCSYKPGCIAYIYRLDQDHCWLKSLLNNPSPCDVCSGQNFLEDKPPSYCYAKYGYDRPGGDLPGMPLYLSSPSTCCEKCKANPDCVTWLWRTDHHHCYLKYVRNNKLYCPACVHGDVY